MADRIQKMETQKGIKIGIRDITIRVIRILMVAKSKGFRKLEVIVKNNLFSVGCLLSFLIIVSCGVEDNTPDDQEYVDIVGTWNLVSIDGELVKDALHIGNTTITGVSPFVIEPTGNWRYGYQVAFIDLIVSNSVRFPADHISDGMYFLPDHVRVPKLSMTVEYSGSYAFRDAGVNLALTVDDIAIEVSITPQTYVDTFNIDVEALAKAYETEMLASESLSGIYAYTLDGDSTELTLSAKGTELFLIRIQDDGLVGKGLDN